jgi:hypothetical protein
MLGNLRDKYYIYFLLNIILVIIQRRMRWHVGGGVRVSYRVLVGKHVGKRLLGRPWSRWKDNIEMCF